jgi:predicted PolB exonuclease-like 3'-5' exonuclease
MINTLVFDIETVPDVEFGRRLHGLSAEMSDEAVANVMFMKQRQARQTEFLPLPQQRVVAISAVLRSRDDVRVFTIGDPASPEKELVQRFFDGLERYVPELVSWNGSGFDLPVLHYRALRHGIVAHRFWELGDADREFRYNNYLNRFHWRHVDLMDVLCGYGASARAGLEQVAVLLGFPGKLGMSGARVWDSFRRGEIEAIRNYCEHDVLNTYLIYLRFQLLRGALDAHTHRAELDLLEAKLAQASEPHLIQFLEAWRSTRHEA